MSDDKRPMHIDGELVRQLAELLDRTHLTEIEVEDGDRRIRVARKAAAVTTVAMPAAASPALPTPAPVASADAPAAPAAKPADDGEAVRSPMVGTVYLSAEPGARPFVQVGDQVSEGQTVVIIEAMKVMNSIAATRAGRVTRICVENGQPVEYDQSLVVVA